MNPRAHSLLSRPLQGLVLLLLTLAAAIPAACSERPAPSADPSARGGQGSPIRVVATTGMIADLVRNVAGDRAQVTQLMGAGIDPHLYKVSPQDVRQLASAHAIFYTGLMLEGKMGDVLARMGEKVPVTAAAENIDPTKLLRPDGAEGHPDPHVWFDVALWSQCLPAIVDGLAKADPQGRELFEANAAAYAARLTELDTQVRTLIATVPKERRVLVTAHDAFGYFARAYDIEVAAIQGISTESEASLKDVNTLVDMLVARKIPAVFVESTVARKTIEALVEGCKARGHAVRIGGELFSDAMGDAGTPEGTYPGMVLHNTRLIVDSLNNAGDTK